MRLSKWFRGILGGEPADEAPSAQASPQQRPWHDDIAHIALPGLLFAAAEPLLRADGSGEEPLTLLYDAFEQTGRRNGMSLDAVMGLADTASIRRHDDEGLRIVMVVLPPPDEVGEAYFVVLGQRDDAAPRCFVLDRSDDGAALLEFTADGARIPRGRGPAPLAETFGLVVGALLRS